LLLYPLGKNHLFWLGVWGFQMLPFLHTCGIFVSHYFSYDIVLLREWQLIYIILFNNKCTISRYSLIHEIEAKVLNFISLVTYSSSVLGSKFKSFIIKQNKKNFKQTKDLNRHLCKESVQIASKHIRRHTTSLIILEVQNKITVKFHHTPLSG
jgi:hypothetical protein